MTGDLIGFRLEVPRFSLELSGFQLELPRRIQTTQRPGPAANAQRIGRRHFITGLASHKIKLPAGSWHRATDFPMLSFHYWRRQMDRNKLLLIVMIACDPFSVTANTGLGNPRLPGSNAFSSKVRVI